MESETKLNTILEWLSPGRRKAAHEAKWGEITEGTGQWFLNSREFKNRENEGGSSLLLVQTLIWTSCLHEREIMMRQLSFGGRLWSRM